MNAVGLLRENYWNGAILDSVDAALRWAANMTWKGISPVVESVKTIYQTGVRPSLLGVR